MPKASDLILKKNKKLMPPEYHAFIKDMKKAGHVVDFYDKFNVEICPYVHVVDPEFVATKTKVETRFFREKFDKITYCLYPVKLEVPKKSEKPSRVAAIAAIAAIDEMEDGDPVLESEQGGMYARKARKGEEPLRKGLVRGRFHEGMSLSILDSVANSRIRLDSALRELHGAVEDLTQEIMDSQFKASNGQKLVDSSAWKRVQKARKIINSF